MTIKLIYLGRSGGGAKFASAVLSSLGDTGGKLIVSSENEEKLPSSCLKIEGIPSGFRENIAFIVQFKKRKQLLKTIIKLIGEDYAIFLMPHPIDFAIKRQLMKSRIVTVIHDPVPHKGDFWPSKVTLFRLARSTETKIFLSEYSYRNIKGRLRGKTVVLPLIMQINEKEEEQSVKKYDFAFLGRHKKYKNYSFQIDLINHLSENFTVFASLPRRFARKLHQSRNLTANTEWIPTKDFDRVISMASCVVLTHLSASQSGIIIEALGAKGKVVAPNIPSLREQMERFGLPWTYEPGSLADAISLSKKAIEDKSDFVSGVVRRTQSDKTQWNQFLNSLIESS